MFDRFIDFPTKITLGAGKIADLGTIASKYGKKAFLMYDPFLKGSELVKKILADLESKGMSAVTFDDVAPNPRNTTIDEASDLCIKEGCDIVIGIGGGSAIDSAKAIAIVAKNGGKCWDYTRKASGNENPKGALPMIAVPTTSGTGTEATPFSVINNPTEGFKATIVDDFCYPTEAIVDPELMVTMPPSVTAQTGIDAFAHVFEAYLSTNDNLFVDTIALGAIQLFVDNIEECVKNGSNVAAREAMTLCSTFGGMCIGHCCTTMPHAIAQALGGVMDAPHGGAIATCINQVIKWTLPEAEDKIAKVSDIFAKGRNEGLSVSEKAAKLPEYIEEKFKAILGGKVLKMSDFGLTEELKEKVLDVCMECYYGDCLIHPRKPTREDIKAVIDASF